MKIEDYAEDRSAYVIVYLGCALSGAFVASLFWIAVLLLK
jgi:hypothetical protein